MQRWRKIYIFRQLTEHTVISEVICGITQNTAFQCKFILLLHLLVENK